MTPEEHTSNNDSSLGFPESPTRVLVVDDELLVAQGIMTSLKALGYEVIGPCKNGVEAIETCRNDKPDIVIMDIQMPVMDGMQAAQIIFPELDIPVIMLTAYSDETYLSKCSEAGVFGFLIKPSNSEQLSAGITIAWNRFLDVVEQRSQIINLKQRLDDRRLIEQAKWIIVKRKNISEPDAMKLLQKQSRSSRKSIAKVARAVIDSDGLL
ncbi:MAG: response regulator [Phycisphaerales bacterium]|nr:response regulator [Planctomycetota bacterium]MBL6996871.1 response regulator [Phycisphaerales bacterium]